MKICLKFDRFLFLPLFLACSFISCGGANGGCDGSLRRLAALQSSDIPVTTESFPASGEPAGETQTTAPDGEEVPPESACVVWDCETDRDCREPLVCDPETHCCAPPPLPACNSPCGTDDDCPLPLICNEETYCCEAPPPAESPPLAACDDPCDDNGLCSNYLTCNGDTYCCEEPIDSCGDFPACDQPEVAACGGCEACSGGDWTCNTGENCCEQAVTSECILGETQFCCGGSDCPADFVCTAMSPGLTLCLNASTDEPQCPRLMPPSERTAVSCASGGQSVCDAAFPLVGPTVCNGSCCVP